jgi:hypothetical protein
MDERARRVGLNEALFRTVNDQVHGLSERFAVLARPMNIVCECERFDCYDRIELTLEEYERIRSDSTRFVIRPQHDAPDVEDVVERREGYWVVRKHEGEPAELACRADDLTS